MSTRRQAIIWTSDGYFTDVYLRHSTSVSWGPSNMAKWHFQMCFYEWKFLYFNWNFTEVCSWGSDCPKVTFSPGCRWAKRQNLNDAQSSPGLNQLTHCYHMVSWILVNIGSGNGLLPEGTKPLPEPVMSYCQLKSKVQTREISIKIQSIFVKKKCIWKCCLQNVYYFVQTSMWLCLFCQFAKESGCAWHHVFLGAPFY